MAGFDPFKGDFGFYGKGLDGYAHYKQLKREQYERNAAERPARRQAKREAELARQRREAEALAEEERMDKIIKFLNVCLYIGLAIFMVWVLATVLAD